MAAMVRCVLCLVVLGGCMGDLGNFDLGDEPLFDPSGLGINLGSVGGHSGRPFELFDDGTNLLVTACDYRGFFGCSQVRAAQPLSASALIDGQLFDVPVDAAVKIWPEEPIASFEHRLQVASPSDPVVELEQRPFELLPAFAVAAGNRTSSAGPITIDYEQLPDATASAIVVTRCADSTRIGGIVRPSTPGHFTLELTGEGSCAHELRITQRVVQWTSWTVPNNMGGTDTIGFSTEVNRVVSVTIASEPLRI